MKAGGKAQEPLKGHPAFKTNFGASITFDSTSITFDSIFDALETELASRNKPAKSINGQWLKFFKHLDSKIKNLESEIKNLKMGLKK